MLRNVNFNAYLHAYSVERVLFVSSMATQTISRAMIVRRRHKALVETGRALCLQNRYNGWRNKMVANSTHSQFS